MFFFLLSLFCDNKFIGYLVFCSMSEISSYWPINEVSNHEHSQGKKETHPSKRPQEHTHARTDREMPESNFHLCPAQVHENLKYSTEHATRFHTQLQVPKLSGFALRKVPYHRIQVYAISINDPAMLREDKTARKLILSRSFTHLLLDQTNSSQWPSGGRYCTT